MLGLPRKTLINRKHSTSSPGGNGRKKGRTGHTLAGGVSHNTHKVQAGSLAHHQQFCMFICARKCIFAYNIQHNRNRCGRFNINAVTNGGPPFPVCVSVCVRGHYSELRLPVCVFLWSCICPPVCAPSLPVFFLGHFRFCWACLLSIMPAVLAHHWTGAEGRKMWGIIRKRGYQRNPATMQRSFGCPDFCAAYVHLAKIYARFLLP